MFFSPKTHAFFAFQTENAIYAARANAAQTPLVLEEVKDAPAGGAAAVAEILQGLAPKRTGNFLRTHIAVNHPRRVVRKAALEPKRIKEEGYLKEVAQSQLRLDVEKTTLAVVQASDGLDFDPGRSSQKEVLFCGMPTQDIETVQSGLVESGVFPERLEIGTLSSLGALVDLLRYSSAAGAVLALEVGSDATHAYLVTSAGVDSVRSIPQGLDAMIPIVQKELGLKDEESARKLFLSNAFDFTGMGPLLVKRLLKELQSAIGFYEVQTGQSVSQLVCLVLPSKLGWLEGTLGSELGVTVFRPDITGWLNARGVTLSDPARAQSFDARWLGFLGMLMPFNLPHAVAPEKRS